MSLRQGGIPFNQRTQTVLSPRSPANEYPIALQGPCWCFGSTSPVTSWRTGTISTSVHTAWNNNNENINKKNNNENKNKNNNNNNNNNNNANANAYDNDNDNDNRFIELLNYKSIFKSAQQ